MERMLNSTRPLTSAVFPRVNAEREQEFNIPAKELVPGITALVRLRNEATWLEKSVESIYEKVDAIGLFLQGDQGDGTDEIAEKLAKDGKIVTHRYPFLSVPNGPGHDRQPISSVYSRAYFYNWCLGQAETTHVLKWDGDLVALDDFDPRGWAERYPCVFFRGHDMASMSQLSIHSHSGWIPLFKVHPLRYWDVGPKSERFQGDGHRVPQPQFLHFKWCKPEASITKAWPDNWQEMEHFQKLWRRRSAGRSYHGPYPRCLTQQTFSSTSTSWP